MYEAISRHRAHDVLDTVAAGRIARADPKHSSTRQAVSRVEQIAKLGGGSAPLVRDESQWDLTAALGGVAVKPMPGEQAGSEEEPGD